MGTRNFPLEWVTDTIVTADATVTNGEFDLNLLPDEIAQILGIDSTIELDTLGEVDDEIDVGMLMSMDPDADDSPIVIANLEDLEVFFHHWFSVQSRIVGAVVSLDTVHKTVNKQLLLPDKYPILVGTNFAQTVIGDGAVATTFITRVYFKRRKASQSDLNQILLKRR